MHTFSEERQKLKVLVDNSPDFMGISNNDNVIEYLNRSAYSLLGIDESVDLNTLRSADFYAPHEAAHMREIYNTLLEKGSWKGNVILRHFKTGELIPGYGSYETVKDPLTGRQIAKSTTIRDLRGELAAQRALLESEQRVVSIVDQAPVAIGVLKGKEFHIESANQAMLKIWGKNASIIGKPVIEALPEIQGQGFIELLQGVYDTGTSYHGNAVPVKLEQNGKLEEVYVDFVYAAVRDAETMINGVLVIASDVTRQILAKKEVEESEAKFRSLIAEAPVPTAVLTGRELIIEIANESMLSLWDRKPAILGMPLADALPELEGQPFLKILDDIFSTGKSFEAQEAKAELLVEGRLKTFYFNYAYKPLFNKEGEVYAIIDMATDVTELVLAKKQAEESELFSRTIIYNSPIAKMVFIGPEMTIMQSNEKMLDMLGRDESIIGKTFVEAIPELVETPLMERMKQVFDTGETYTQPEEKLELQRFGKPYTGYYQYIYKALRTTAGDIYGIMVTSMEITDQVHARQEIEQAKVALQGAIDLADLGTWNIDLKTRTIHYDARLRSWFGFSEDEVITPERAALPCIPEDLPRLQQAIMQAIAPGTDGVYDVEYTIRNLHTGLERILHAQGKTFRDANGEAYQISGSVQDVTIERKIELELIRQVQERTEELAASNEELAASNEELQSMNEEMTVINEEMEETNQSLYRSNGELSQYAYVASHDLQEPLRKIRVYTGMLSNQEGLAAESRPLVDKISKSSERMSLLINDLLEFSKLNKSENMLRPVDLNDSLREVITDFELTIAEKKAVIDIEPLPVIDAVALQMNQLFYNLISNALKFTDPAIPPRIVVKTRTMLLAEIRTHIQRPLPEVDYYDISITDNGIGFDVKYADQIFEVFKRLHGKDVYPGSGIGLALCRRIAINHGGGLYADSQEGMGTTFHVILPAMMKN